MLKKVSINDNCADTNINGSGACTVRQQLGDSLNTDMWLRRTSPFQMRWLKFLSACHNLFFCRIIEKKTILFPETASRLLFFISCLLFVCVQASREALQGQSFLIQPPLLQSGFPQNNRLLPSVCQRKPKWQRTLRAATSRAAPPLHLTPPLSRLLLPLLPSPL